METAVYGQAAVPITYPVSSCKAITTTTSQTACSACYVPYRQTSRRPEKTEGR